MTILQGTITWTGFQGAPGYTNLHVRNAGIITTAVDNLVTGLQTMCTDIKSQEATGVTLTASQEVKEFDEATGALVGLHTSTVAVPPQVGAGGAQGPSPVGGCISFTTNGVNRGRRVRGRLFVVPVAGNRFESNGSLAADFIAALNTIATNWYVTAARECVIWSRPRSGAGGAAFDIVSHHVTDQAAVLRSRRD